MYQINIKEIIIFLIHNQIVLKDKNKNAKKLHYVGNEIIDQ